MSLFKGGGEDCVIVGNTGGGIELDAPANVTGNEIEYISATGVSVRERVKIVGNDIDGAGTLILLETVVNSVISNNTLTQAATTDEPCIHVDDNSDRNVISGNTIETAYEGIQVTDSTNNVISDNVIDRLDASFGDNTYDLIILDGDSDGNQIIGNRLLSPGGSWRARYGINISASTCDDNAVIHNYIGADADYGTGGLNDAGTNTIFHGNVGDPGSGIGAPAETGSRQEHFTDPRATLTAAAGTMRWLVPFDLTIINFQIIVATVPTGADLILDVHQNGTTIFTTQANRPRVVASDADGIGAETVPDITSLSEGDYLTFDIDQIGSTVAGGYLDLVMEYELA